jgi:transposase
MDFLEEHKVEVEKAVYFKTADIMKADVDLIFYDTTSLHFEIDEEDEVHLDKQGRKYPPLRKRGYSKNGRSDAPQIVVGLAVTRDGLPVRSWVFSGETGDVTTVERVKEDLRGWRLGRAVFVGDAGMNSEENRRKLALGNGKYILASRMRAGDEVTNEVLTRPGRYKAVRDNLRVKEVFVGDGERRQRYVVCHNADEAKRQRAHRAKLIEQLEAELASLKTSPGGSHSKRACKLISSSRYGKYLRETAQGNFRIDQRAVKDAMRYDGKWVITSNDDTLTAEDLALGYKQLLRVEQCWRQMKSGLRMRPVFHRRPWRIQAHVTITLLALMLERIAEIRAGDTWRNIVDQLDTIKVVEYERGPVRVRQTTQVRPSVTHLLQKLRIPIPPKVHSVTPVPETTEAKEASLPD